MCRERGGTRWPAEGACGASSGARLGLEPVVQCVCFFPFILDVKFVGRTSRGNTGGRSHRISRPPSFCGACLNFSREKDSAIPFPCRPWSRILCTNDSIVLHPLGIFTVSTFVSTSRQTYKLYRLHETLLYTCTPSRLWKQLRDLTRSNSVTSKI